MVCVVFHGRYKEVNVEKKAVKLVLGLFAMTGVLYLLHTAGGFYIRSWHVAPAAPLTIVLIALVLHLFAGSSFRNRFARGAFVAVYIILLMVSGARLWLFSPFRWQKENIKAIEWVTERPNAKVAMYDAGIVSYYTDGAIFPIDANVNVEVQKALEERRVFDYMVENDVDYLIGWEYVLPRYRHFWPYPHKELFVDVTPKTIIPVKYKGLGLGEFRYYKLNASYVTLEPSNDL